MATYIARKCALINGVRYQAGEVVPEAEKLQKIRTLVSAGFLVKREDVGPPPPTPADLSPATKEVPLEEVPLEEASEVEAQEAPQEVATILDEELGLGEDKPQLKGAEQDDVDIQRQPSEQPAGRSEVRDRGHEGAGPTPVKRGNTVRVSTVRK